ncbi:MAG TPA: HAMP domain-containing sensor histidine kinase, partial [Labilithrix sp.]|nr:HAMP domain-containing sensor histidine kinase [Labilithrix sp.]
LVEQELRAIDDLRFAVDRYIAVRRANAPESERLEAVDDIRAILYELLDMNLRLGLVSRGASEKITTETLWLTGVLGLLGIAAAIIVGVRVRNAIAPRIECLVAKVRKFQETGVIEVGPEQEGDELSVLNHALDVGFTAIEARDRERNRFMSVAAHELKTPVSNIQAFAQTALAYPQGSALRDRALEVISRQAQRIARLVEDMFLVARARSKDLPFAPAPMNIVESVEKIAAELEASNPERHFELNTSERGALFGDVELLSAALWTMLSYGLGRSSPETSVNVRISRSALQVLVTLSNFGPGFTNHELSRVFEPLVEIRYEGTKVPRNALGLYLCAEIARLHGGSMSAHNDAEGRPVLVLALPA